MSQIRYMSLKLGERIITLVPGDEVHMHDHNKIELLPGYTHSGLIISHEDHDLVLRVNSFMRIKTTLDYVRK